MPKGKCPPDSEIFALVVVENHSEAMDVSIISDILVEFGIQVFIASTDKDEAIQLTGNVKIFPNLSLSEASRDDWHLLILPGGNRAMRTLMENEQFGSLLKNHQGLVAALGAFAVALADPLGPTSYPMKDSPVVIKESDTLWTCPGLGTTAELALALGDHFFGTNHALQVAQHIKHQRQSWDVHKIKSSQTIPLDHFHQKPASNTFKSTATTRHQTMITTAYFDIVWPTLRNNGWTSQFRDGWKFTHSNYNAQHLGEQGVDWFDSPNEVLQYLDTIPAWDGLMANFRAKLNSSPSQQKGSISTSDPLFDRVVWPRLKLLQWTCLPHIDGVVFQTPEGIEIQNPSDVLQFLTMDPTWRLNPKALCILDMYQNCQRVQDMICTQSDPASIEKRTKHLMPALATY